MASATRAVMAALRALRRRVAPPPIVRLVHDERARVLDNQLLLGRSALVTGAGRNIGRSVALEMARQGANIYFTDLRPDAVSALQCELEALGVRARGFVSDIADASDVDALGAALDADGIVIDVLVNNVGVASGRGIRTLTNAEVRTVFDTNVFGPLQLTRYVANALLNAERPGAILFITSVHERSTSGALAYSASKAALGMVVKELALELAPHRIRVNAIAPGGVNAAEPDLLLPFAGSVLIGSSIHPSYIGRAAVYLAADYFSQFTTGSTLTVDAGLLTRRQNR